MNRSLVDSVTTAVMYEGYILYPYRPSLKNRQRWTFGGLYPRSFCDAHDASEPWVTETQCLIAGSADTVLEIELRFLHLMMRTAGQLAAPLQQWPAEGEPEYRCVEALQIGSQWYPTIFNTADLTILTKIDLAEAVEFDRDVAYASVHAVRPGMHLLEVSAKTGEGLDNWLGGLMVQREADRSAPLPTTAEASVVS